MEKGGLFYTVDPGCFQPEKPIFRAFFGVVHPPTPHPPILPPSVHKIHIPQPLIPTLFPLHSKTPKRLRFFKVISNSRTKDTELHYTHSLHPKEPFLVIRAKKEKNASEPPVVRASILTDNWRLWYTHFPLLRKCFKKNTR